MSAHCTAVPDVIVVKFSEAECNSCSGMSCTDASAYLFVGCTSEQMAHVDRKLLSPCSVFVDHLLLSVDEVDQLAARVFQHAV